MPTVESKLQKFDRDKGWYYIPIPLSVSSHYAHLADRGLVAVSATVRDMTWNTSLLPMGDGTHFIALPQKIRNKYDLRVDETLEVSFEPR